jgi:tRNA(fMet)-specific endonuclease VapC
VVKSELFAGAYKSKNKEKILDKLKIFFSPLKSLSFNDEAAEAYGKIRADLEKKGTPIGPYDLQIASIAVFNDLTLVTHNKREFRRVEGLDIEDWE